MQPEPNNIADSGSWQIQLNDPVIEFQRQKKIFIESSQRYRYYWIFLSIPIGIIAMIDSITALISASDLVEENSRKILSVVIGIIGIILTSVASWYASLELKTKEKMFRQAASEYDELIHRFQSGYYTLNQPDITEKIDKKLQRIRNSCPYHPPIGIIRKYDV